MAMPRRGRRLEGWRLAQQQLLFMLWRQWLTKRRQWLQTTVEVLSPVLVLLALVAAYRMTDPIVYHDTSYVYETENLIGSGVSLLTDGLAGERGEPGGSLTPLGCVAGALQDLQLPPLQTLAQATNTPWDPAAGWPGSAASAGGPNGDRTPGHSPWGDPDPAGPSPGSLQDAAAEALVEALVAAAANETFVSTLQQCGQMAVQKTAGKLMNLFLMYIWNKGPLPALTLDEFVGLSRGLEAAMSAEPQLGQVLHNFKRDFGWNWLGNLVGLGGLAFTPATDDVLRFTEHMSANHAFFDDVFMGVYDDPDELWSMASNGQPFWAVIQFDLGPSTSAGAVFTIRMPFLETPETWVAIDKFGHRHHQNKYKMYVTSGFTSLQSAVHAYVLGYNSSLEASLLVPRQPGHGCSPGGKCGLRPQGAQAEAEGGEDAQGGSGAPSAPNGEQSAGEEGDKVELVPYNVWFAMMPKPGYVYNQFYMAVGPMLGLLLCLSLIFPLAMLTRGVVEEKELKQRELLMVMGLRSGPLMLSWALTYLAVFLAVSGLSVAVAGATFLAAASKSLLLVYYAAFSAAEVAFGLMLAALFTRAKVAAVVAPLAHFAATMPRYVFFKTGAPQAVAAKYAVCLLAPSAFTFGADLIAQYEEAGGGLQWADVWADEGLPFGAVCVMMVFDAVLYGALAVYLTRVIPQSPGGFSSPWYWPWGGPGSGRTAWRRRAGWWAGRGRGRGGRRGARRHASLREEGEGGDVALASLDMRGGGGQRGFTGSTTSRLYDNEGFSLLQESNDATDLPESALPSAHPSAASAAAVAAASGATVGSLAAAAAAESAAAAALSATDPRVAAVLHRLKLRYPNGVMAVGGLSLELRTGELTALLGHNGAGKSSTISLLTGLVAPSAGGCWVGGRCVATNTQAARLSLGLCPQHNVLFGALTVTEHLALVAGIKGVPRRGGACLAAATRMAATVGLGAPADLAAPAGTLSGGMKRKLQVGMALIGGSKLVVLDEPSAGMCPAARRGLWALLRAVQRGEGEGQGKEGGEGEEGGGRALLMSTHHLEEADVLADKVAIMSAGQLVAFGSPLELKQRHANGYFLTLTRSPAAAAAAAATPTAPLPTVATPTSAATTASVSALGASDGGAGPGKAGALLADLGDVGPLLAAVGARVPGARLARSAAGGREVVVRLPREEAHLFPGLFSLLEDPASRQQLGVTHYGLAMPSLEEVFLATTTAAAAGGAADATLFIPSAAAVTAASRAAVTRGSSSDVLLASSGVNGGAAGAAGFEAAALGSLAHRAKDLVVNDNTCAAQAYATGNGTAPLAALAAPTVTVSALAEVGHLQEFAPAGAGFNPAPFPPRPVLDGDRAAATAAASAAWALPLDTASSYAAAAAAGAGTAAGADVSRVLYSSSASKHLGPQPLAEGREAEFGWFQSKSTEANGREEEEEEEETGKAERRGLRVWKGAVPVEEGAAAAGGDVWVRGGWRHHWRCFRQMIWKRSRVTARDWKGLAWLFLLPVVAIALTLLVLTANVDPTGPSLLLSLRASEQFTPVPVANNPAPDLLGGCLGPSRLPPGLADRKPKSHTVYEGWVPKYDYRGPQNCPLGMEFESLNASLTDSAALSEWLLQQAHAGAVPLYGAVVYDDPVARNLSTALSAAAADGGARAQQAWESSGANLTTLYDYLGLLSSPGGTDSLTAATVRQLERTNPEDLAALLKPLLDRLPKRQQQQQRQGTGAGTPRSLMSSSELQIGAGREVGEGEGMGQSGSGGRRQALAARRRRGLLGVRPAGSGGSAQAAGEDGEAGGSGRVEVSARGSQSRWWRRRRQLEAAATAAFPSSSRQLLALLLGDRTATAAAAAAGLGLELDSSRGFAGTGQAVAGGPRGVGAAAGASDIAALKPGRALLQQQEAGSGPGGGNGGSAMSGLTDDSSGSAGSSDLDPGDLAALLAGMGGSAGPVASADLPVGASPLIQQLAGLLTQLGGGGVDLSGLLPDGLLPDGGAAGVATGGDSDDTNAAISWLLRLLPALMGAAGDVDVAAVTGEGARVAGVLRGLAARFAQPPVVLLFNGSAWHSSVALLNDLRQGLAAVDLSAVAGMSGQQLAAETEAADSAAAPFHLDRPLRLTNHPLPLTATDAAALDTFLSVLAAIFVLVPFCYLSGAYAVAPVSEARCGSKALQLGAGCSAFIYWAGHAAFDYAVHLAVCLVAMAVFWAFGDAATTGAADRAAAAFLLLMGYGIGVAPLSYCYSLKFSSPSAAQVTVSAVNFLLGFMFVVGSQTMQGIPECQAFQRVAVHFCRLLPPFNLGEGLINLAAYTLMAKVSEDLSQQQEQGGSAKDSIIPDDALPAGYNQSSPFDWSVVGRNLAALYGTAVLYFLLVVLLDRWRSDPRWGAAVRAVVRQSVDTVAVYWRAAVMWVRGGARGMAWAAEGVRLRSGGNGGARSWSTCLPAAREAQLRQRALFDGYERLGARGVASGEDAGVNQLTANAGILSRAGGGGVGGSFPVAVPLRPTFIRRDAVGFDVEGDVEASSLLLPYEADGGGAALGGSPEYDATAAEEDGYPGGGGGGNGVSLAGREPAAVVAERWRVEAPEGEAAVAGDSICVRRLRKVYPTRPPKVALASLSLGIRPGERFGFLGANGAGKSTALSIIAGQQLPSAGTAAVAGYDVVRQREQASHLLGYCPQTDPLLEHLSAREQLSLVAALKGLPQARLAADVADLMARCALPLTAADRPAGQLSGGNRRKVSLAAALLGSPVAVMLDEPSAGMDPGARRMMWDAILNATATATTTTSSTTQRPQALPATPHHGDVELGLVPTRPATVSLSPHASAYSASTSSPAPAPVALVLTTHYMDECEVLCERVGIMSAGRLVCLGAPQELKSLYGSDYMLELQMQQTGGPDAAAAVVGRLAVWLSGARLREAHEGHVKVALPARGLSLAKVFQVLESQRDALGLATYSVSQPTLEQVFLAVTGRRATIDDDGEEVREEPEATGRDKAAGRLP